MSDHLLTYVLRQGDRALVLAQRLLEEVTHAPEIEEDMALSNLALDLIGQARVLYDYASQIDDVAVDAEGNPRDENYYAYWRADHEFMSPLLVEQPNDDFAHVIARQFLHDAYALPYWQAMTASSDSTLAALAGKAVKETAYHLRHARSWLVRLGDGTETSHERVQAAIELLWRYTDELFEQDDVENALASTGVAVDPAAIRVDWDRMVDAALTEATLERPADGVMQTGGRHGHHTEPFSYLIGELQIVARAHPGASW